MSLVVQPWALEQLPWSDRSAQEGEADCICSLCNLVIGVPEDDPRRDEHDRDSCNHFEGDCAICEIAFRVFRDTGHGVLEQRYHHKCFERVIRVMPKLGPEES
jgi:hypothetical protein